MTPPPACHSYLLRLWKDAPEADWRGSVQAITARGIQVLNGLEGLRAFLQDQAGEAPPAEADSAPGVPPDPPARSDS